MVKSIGRYKLVVAGVILLQVLLITGCSPGEPDTTYGRLLHLIPDTEATRSGVFLNDLELAAEIAGIIPPYDEASGEQVIEYLLALSRPPMATGNHFHPHASGTRLGGYAEPFLETSDYRGFDQRHVTATAITGDEPQIYEIVFGRFDPDRFATENPCDVCPEYTLMQHKGAEWYSWSEDYEQFSLERSNKPPVFDNLGRGGNWLVEEDQLYRTLASADMRTLIDAGAGDVNTLGDRREFVELASAMNDLNAYSIYISTKTIEKSVEVYVGSGGYGLSPEQEALLRRRIDGLPSLRPYIAFALGSGLDEKGPYSAAAFYFDSKKDAEESATQLPGAVLEGRTIEGGIPFAVLIPNVETEVDGKILKARLRHEETRGPLWAHFLYNGDLIIFAHD